ncbi:hypothetical protein Plhal304r1_c065g0152541 [Plasmopara halstedii]
MALTIDELARAAQLGFKYIVEEVSWRDVLKMSSEAGTVHPTLVGYALGAIATIFYARCSLWVLRFIFAAFCLMLLLHTLHTLERQSQEWLLLLAAGTGICCTYMQLASLDLVKVCTDKLISSNRHKKNI